MPTNYRLYLFAIAIAYLGAWLAFGQWYFGELQ